jgi:hypothetical protein
MVISSGCQPFWLKDRLPPFPAAFRGVVLYSSMRDARLEPEGDKEILAIRS